MALVRLRHETDDWLKITPKHKGELFTGDFSYQIRPYGVGIDEDEWLIAVTDVDGDKGADIENLSRGLYEVFIRIDGQTPYAPVLTKPLLMT